ncbi:hypothetical protein TNCV_3221961 [Trichonephila clavipes]|nr:hypothetical protein TNCV_3221961 [Trichonephila clavipes]
MCYKSILCVKALLQKLRDFEVIKEFNLQPLEANEENWNLFKSPLKTIVYELNIELSMEDKVTKLFQDLRKIERKFNLLGYPITADIDTAPEKLQLELMLEVRSKCEENA